MALTFRPTMDPHSMDVRCEGVSIGYIAWHLTPAFHLTNTNSPITLDEMKQIVEKLSEVSGKAKNANV